MAREPIVIVGGGRAAVSLVDAYREAGGEALLIMISADAHPPYNRPPLSKGVLRREMEPDEAIVHSAAEYEDLLVDLRLDSEVASVDPAARLVRLGTGEEIRYGTLVIATGSRPRMLSVPGSDLPAVQPLRTLDDAIALRESAGTARSALVVGGSFIGSEVAASLRMLGLEVTVVETGPRLVPALGSRELSEQVEGLYREHGVELLLGEEVAEFHANGRSLRSVELASGESIEAFLVVVGVGVEPNTAFLEGSGIEVDDGVVVDDRFHASVPDVYAIGDVANFDDVASGRQRRIEHWSNASAQGDLLGRNLAGGRKPYLNVPSFFTKMFDVQLQLLGDPAGADEVVVRGSIAARNLVGLYLRDERLVAASLVGQAADTARDLTDLIRERRTLTNRGQIANPDVRPARLFAAAAD